MISLKGVWMKCDWNMAYACEVMLWLIHGPAAESRGLCRVHHPDTSLFSLFFYSLTGEAIHLGSLIAAQGYVFPISDHVLTLKDDGTFYRFQVGEPSALLVCPFLLFSGSTKLSIHSPVRSGPEQTLESDIWAPAQWKVHTSNLLLVAGWCRRGHASAFGSVTKNA